MRISGNFCQPVNPFLNTTRVNSGIQNNVAALGGGQNRDRVSISPQGKATSMIEGLMKRKEEVTERKNALIGDTLESGQDIKTIEGQLDMYDEQLTELDKQIAQITADLAAQAAEKAEEKKAKESDEEKSTEEAQAAKLSRLAAITDDVRNAETIAQVRNRAAGEIRVEEAEIHNGKLDIQRLEDKAGDGTNVRKLVENAKRSLAEKVDSVATMEIGLNNLSAMQGEALSEAVSAIDEEQEVSADAQTAPADDPTTLVDESVASED